MKKKYVLPSLAIAAIGLFAFQAANTDNGVVRNFTKSHMLSSGGQSGLTGAPGEANCTQCHSGTTLDGSSQNVFTMIDAAFNTVTSYTPGVTYTASLALLSDPAKKGFSSVALDGTDTNAGSFTGSGIGGTQNFSAAGRDYVSHTASSNTSATATWGWTWVAPATSVGDVTFYIASNTANGNGTASGDEIFLSQHVITDATASVEEASEVHNDFVAGYNVSNNQVIINFTNLGSSEMHMNLVDMNGRSVFTSDLGLSQIGENSESIALPTSLKDGMYVVHFFVGNKAMSANILVRK